MMDYFLFGFALRQYWVASRDFLRRFRHRPRELSKIVLTRNYSLYLTGTTEAALISTNKCFPRNNGIIFFRFGSYRLTAAV